MWRKLSQSCEHRTSQTHNPHVCVCFFYLEQNHFKSQAMLAQSFKSISQDMLSLTSDLFDKWSNVEGCQGRLFCWLDDHCVSTAQGWCYLPREHQQRKVPLTQTDKKKKKNPHMLAVCHQYVTALQFSSATLSQTTRQILTQWKITLYKTQTQTCFKWVVWLKKHMNH